MKGYTAGVARIYQDKDATKQVIGKFTKTGLDEQMSPAAKTADPNTFIDSSLIDELQKSGFIDSLYK